MGGLSRTLARRFAVIAAAFLLVGPAPALAGTGGGAGRPLAVMPTASGSDIVLFQGSNSDLWENTFSAGAWGAPTDTGIGPLGSAPSVTLGPGGNEYVFWEGTDQALYYATSNNGTTWGNTTRVGLGPLGGQPTVTSWGSSAGVELNVFWQGTDGNLFEGWLPPGGVWNGPTNLGQGQLGSAPTAFAVGESSTTADLSVFWEGTNADLYTASTSGGPTGTFSGPTNLGFGLLGSAPSVGLLEPSGAQDVFWRSPEGDLWEAQATSEGAWTHKMVVTGPLGSAPTTAAVWPDEEDVFWVGPNGGLYAVRDENGTFSTPVGPGAMTVPAATTAPVIASPTPVTVSTPSPSPTKPTSEHHRTQLHARISTRWTWLHDRNTLRRIVIQGLPRHGVIRVRCVRRGCPTVAGRFHGRQATRRLRRDVVGKVFHSGERLLITLSAPGLIPERVAIIIRLEQKPIAKLR